MSKLLLLSMVVVALPAVAPAEPAPAEPQDRQIDCERDPVCIAARFADALSLPPAGPQALRLDVLVAFEPGSTRVYSSGREQLMALAASWRQHARWTTITVEGHAGHDPALARRRADKIRGYLVRYGVAPDYVVATAPDEGRGDAQVRRMPSGRVDLAIALCDPTSEACRTPGLRALAAVGDP